MSLRPWNQEIFTITPPKNTNYLKMAPHKPPVFGKWPPPPPQQYCRPPLTGNKRPAPKSFPTLNCMSMKGIWYGFSDQRTFSHKISQPLKEIANFLLDAFYKLGGVGSTPEASRCIKANNRSSYLQCGVHEARVTKVIQTRRKVCLKRMNEKLNISNANMD